VFSLHIQKPRKQGPRDSAHKSTGALGQHDGPLPTRVAAPKVAPPVVREVLGASGRSLDVATRAFFEPRFGLDLSRVRVHADEKAAQSAQAVDAAAYTVGRDIVFDQGRYAPHTTEGRRLLGHELTHVLQQARSEPASAELRIGKTDDAAEKEAEGSSATTLSPWWTATRSVASHGLSVHVQRLPNNPNPNPQAMPAWSAAQIETGIQSYDPPGCWASATAIGQAYFGTAAGTGGGSGNYSSGCPVVCAHKPVPLRLLYHVDGTTIPRPGVNAGDVLSGLSAVVKFLPDSGGESILVQGTSDGIYQQPGYPLLTSFRTDLRFFTPPETGSLLVTLANSDRSGQGLAVFSDQIPVVECPGSGKPGIPVPTASLQLGKWLVVPDPENAPMQYSVVDKYTPVPGPGVITELEKDDSGYLYRYKGRKVYLPEKP